MKNCDEEPLVILYFLTSFGIQMYCKVYIFKIERKYTKGLLILINWLYRILLGRIFDEQRL